MHMYWPIALAVVADVAYQIASKQTPEAMNMFGEWKLANWITVVLGLAIVGLEAGSIYMFRAGWDVSVGPMVKNAIIAIALLALGFLVCKEPVTGTKIAGIGLCLAGLWFINR